MKRLYFLKQKNKQTNEQEHKKQNKTKQKRQIKLMRAGTQRENIT